MDTNYISHKFVVSLLLENLGSMHAYWKNKWTAISMSKHAFTTQHKYKFKKIITAVTNYTKVWVKWGYNLLSKIWDF